MANRLAQAGLPVAEAMAWAAQTHWAQGCDTFAGLASCLSSDVYEGETHGLPLKTARRYVKILEQIAAASAAERAAEARAAEEARWAKLEAEWGSLVPTHMQPPTARRWFLSDCDTYRRWRETKEATVRRVLEQKILWALRQWAEAQGGGLWATRVVETGGDAWEGHDEAGVGLSGGDYVTESSVIISAWAHRALKRLTEAWDFREETVATVASEEVARWREEWARAEKFLARLHTTSVAGPVVIIWDDRAKEVRIERRASRNVRVIARARWDLYHEGDAHWLTPARAIEIGRPVPACIRSLMTPETEARIERVTRAKERLARIRAARAWREERERIRRTWRERMRWVWPDKGLSPRGQELIARIVAAQRRAEKLRAERIAREEEARRAAEWAQRQEEIRRLQEEWGKTLGAPAPKPTPEPEPPKPRKEWGTGNGFKNNPFADLDLKL
jgi:hypothetical protein